MARMHYPRRGGGRAFTLIELLVVVSIIALLISILLPSLKKARDQAKDAVCRSNLHQLGLANQYYATENKERLPWVEGAPGGAGYHAPFFQYQQIFHLIPYVKTINVFRCPQATMTRSGRHSLPRSVLAYRQGNLPTVPPSDANNGSIGIYWAIVSDRDWVGGRRIQGRYFPASPTRSGGPTGQFVPGVYTEYWFNDWNWGASTIPAISGNLLNRIGHPDFAIMMMDAVPGTPRHRSGQHMVFLDGHVGWYRDFNYFDWEATSYQNTRDKDQFGNTPFWCWGLRQPGGAAVIGRNFPEGI